MTKPPAFQFYVNDFLVGTRKFTAEEVGAYLLLLCEQWDNGFVKEADLEIVAKLPKEKLHRVLSKFNTSKKGLVNKRMEQVRKTQKKNREINSKNGRHGAKKRWSTTTKKTNELNSEATFSPLANDSSSSSTSSSIYTTTTDSTTYIDRIFEVLRRARGKEFSDKLLMTVAGKVAAYAPESEVKNLGKLCGKFLQDVQADLKPKEMVY